MIEYLPQPFIRMYSVHLAYKQPDQNGQPINEIDDRTIYKKDFYTESEANAYVIKVIKNNKTRGDLRWLAYVYVQKTTVEFVKDYTEWLAMC